MSVPVLCPGEDVHIRLFGSCEEVDVHLEPDLVHLTQTYISLSTVDGTVSLINKHDVPLQYRWTSVSSIQEEPLDLLRFVCTHTMSPGGPRESSIQSRSAQEDIILRTRMGGIIPSMI